MSDDGPLGDDGPAPIGDALRAFAARLLEEGCEAALATAYVGHLRAMEVPLLQALAHVPEADLVAMQAVGMRDLLGAIAAGTALALAHAQHATWEADGFEGISRDAVQPADLALIHHAQERTLLDRAWASEPDPRAVRAIAEDLRAFYVAVQRDALEVFDRIRAQAFARAVRAEHARDHEKAFVQRVIDHVPTGLAFLDKDLVFRQVNPAFAGFAGLAVEAFEGRSYHDVFPLIPNPNPRFAQVLASGEVLRMAGLPYELPHGRTHWDIVYVPVFDDTGAVEGMILMTQDATERVRQEHHQQAHIDQLQEMDRLKDEFLSVLSHELRTPINAIMGFASILADGLSGPLTPDQTRFTRRILEGADVLLALINDLLDMSRIQAGKFSLNPAPTDVAAVARRVAAATSALAERRGQRVEVRCADDLPLVVADAQRLAQVLTNLVSNAIKFGPEGDVLVLDVRRAGGRVRCEVEDHGEGIAAADLPKLFKRFTQLDMGATRRAGGTGLGLYIVKALVESHGGEVGVESQPGVRTTFWFELPLVAKEAPGA